MSLPSPVVDLTARRERAERAIAEVAAAPVRYVPDELFVALQGSWGGPESSAVADVALLPLSRMTR
jgi:hypothetical protein